MTPDTPHDPILPTLTVNVLDRVSGKRDVRQIRHTATEQGHAFQVTSGSATGSGAGQTELEGLIAAFMSYGDHREKATDLAIKIFNYNSNDT